MEEKKIEGTEGTGKTGISRRSFLTGLAAAGALTAVGAGLAACSPGAETAEEKPATDEGSAAPTEIVETLEADIVIAGSGMSGLAAAVEAALDGNKVLVLEKANAVGGNGQGTEGMFAVGSSLQQAAGIHIDPRDIIMAEAEEGQYRVDGSLWMDLVTKSAENIEWCKEQGVEYSGVVDNYYTGLYSTMHWFKDGKAAEGYVPQMDARAQELGVEFRFETAADSLIIEDGKVVGLYAKATDGSYIQINAKAVILATGGIGNNAELMAQQGWGNKAQTLTLGGYPAIDGDGYKMAMAAGARDFLSNSCQLVTNFVPAFGNDTTPPYDDPLNSSQSIFSGGPILWVNQDADRFVDENVVAKNMMLQSVALKGIRDSYAIFDSSLIESLKQRAPEVEDALAKGLAENAGDSIFTADTVEGLAEAFGLDSDELTATVSRYNDLCKGGEDLDFGKESAQMVPIEKPPLYIAKMQNNVVVTIGAITTNKRREVLDEDFEAIPGLYAAGVDGAMLWRNVYTINMPGTCNGNNINSGREAAQNATTYIKGA